MRKITEELKQILGGHGRRVEFRTPTPDSMMSTSVWMVG